MPEANDLPLVTIGILSYNRCEPLRATLDCITRAIEYPNLEIIVVDNNSADGTLEMLRDQFPDIRCIRMPENIGVSARNEFYRAARGEFIFSYDDDSFPATPATILEAVRLMQSRPDIGASSFLCLQPITGFIESSELEHFGLGGDLDSGIEGLFFVEGGMCIRRSAFERIAGYDREFAWGAEGADLTLQLYREGIMTLYYPMLATLHMKSALNRSTNENAMLFTRNYVWTIAKHFPCYAAVAVTAAYIVRRVVGMVLHPAFVGAYARGIVAGLAGSLRQRRKCAKLSLRQVLHLNRWYLFLLRW